jgi:hypothetical protein
MREKILAFLLILAFVSISCGCASIPEEHKGAGTGAAVGGATGAVAGALLGASGAKTEMAIVGGLVGVLVGGAIGHYAYDKKRDREQTNSMYNYQSTSGPTLRIEDVSALPATARPGDTVDLNTTYAVMTPDPESEIRVTEIREIRHAGDLVGRPEITVTRSGGTYTSSIPLILPNDAKSGEYVVTTTVQTANASDSRSTTLYVR